MVILVQRSRMKLKLTTSDFSDRLNAFLITTYTIVVEAAGGFITVRLCSP